MTPEELFDDILLDYCDVDCTDTHTDNEHVVIQNVVKDRLKAHIDTHYTANQKIEDLEDMLYVRGVDLCEETGNTKDDKDHRFHCHFKKGYNQAVSDFKAKLL